MSTNKFEGSGEPINIIGGGIGGLTMANALTKAGINFKLFEQAPMFTEIGAAIGLSKGAIDIMEALGLKSDLLKAGAEIQKVCLADKQLNIIKTVTQEWPSIIIHRAKLIDILAANISKENIQLNTKLTGIENHSGFSVLKFSDGSMLKSTCTIIADGINSIARKHLLPDIKLRYAGHTLWRGITPIELPKQYQDTYTEIWSDAKRFLFGPIDSKNVTWLTVQNTKPGEEKDAKVIKHSLIKDFNDFHPIVKELLLNSSNYIRSELADLGNKSRKWYINDTIVFLGDSIHATTPNFAQGGCQAIEDAYCLTQLMKINPRNYADIFSTYQNLRKDKVSFIVNGSWQVGKFAHNPILWRLARFALSHIPTTTSVKMNRRINDLSYLNNIADVGRAKSDYSANE